MTEIFTLVAALCSIHADSPAWQTDLVQSKCHAYYSNCLIKKLDGSGIFWKNIALCIQERKP